MPTANVSTVGGDQSADFQTGTSRSFDFSNLASEGVSTLEVYKTGRAGIPSGGIGATINVKHPPSARRARPACRAASASRASTTPAWTRSWKTRPSSPRSLRPAELDRPGREVRRHRCSAATRSATSPAAASRRTTGTSAPMRTSSTRTTASSATAARPRSPTRRANGSTLVAIPNDSRYHFSQGNRERINGQATVQWRPTENILITADGLYAQNKSYETPQRPDQLVQPSVRPGDLRQQPHRRHRRLPAGNLSGTKDKGFEQQYRANKDELQSFGLNGVWDVTDRFKLSLDGHISKASSDPDARTAPARPRSASARRSSRRTRWTTAARSRSRP